ncbi:MAG: peptidoglycan editing factor PgeF [Bacteroidota bacterium]|nr:peptidoglycan editing factor PgeF [Bacteroidota bacterium]
MSTRQGGVSPGKLGLNLSFNVGDERANVEENRNRFFHALQISESSIAFPAQCHSDKIQTVTNAGRFESCDGLMAQKENVFLAVSVADCVPVFLFDRNTKTVAAVHAGWRGTRSRILERAVQNMIEEFSVNPRDLVAFIGPSAGSCCYEVGEEVALEFTPEFITESENRKFKLDLKSANRSQLLKAGVFIENIEVHPSCTICHPERFHSYRRDGKASGRMLGVIGMKLTVEEEVQKL